MILDAKQQALESLIRGSDPRTRQVIRQELVTSFPRHRKILRQLSRSPFQDIQQFASEIISECGTTADGNSKRSSTSSYAASVAPTPDRWESLEDFCWWLCVQEFSGFSPQLGRAALDRYAERVDDVSPGCHGPYERVLRLRRVLAGELGFRGNIQDYYCPHNSLLNRVIETRTGIPLSLSLLYIFIGRRVGWDVCGLHFPGHFVACIDNVVFDPFFSGKILCCQELKDRFFLPECEFHDLAPYHAEPHEVARRMLGNLFNAYNRIGDMPRLQRTADLLQQLSESA
ncbi:MAG: transglutaminase family protein [Candidatus Methylacidiphilales bacterium]